VLACLDEEPPAGREPLRGTFRDPPLEVQAVSPSVKRQKGLVLPGLGRHERDLGSRHVGGIGGEDPHLAPQTRWERLEQVAVVSLAANFRDIAPRNVDGGWLDIG
jgi:hypothetical protein